MDRISVLEDKAINLILERLPLIDRVKTSVLSKNWRLRWTSISSLPMDMTFYCSIHSPLTLKKYSDIINSIMLQHTSHIRDFSLYIPECKNHTPSSSSLYHSICLAIKNNSIKTLKLEARPEGVVHVLAHLPSCIFSSVNLKRLEIHYFCFHPPPGFKGFPNLKFLEIHWDDTVEPEDFNSPSTHTVSPPAHIMSWFISVCPRLEEIKLAGVWWVDDQDNLVLEAPKLRSLVLDGCFKGVYVSNAPNLENIEIWVSTLSGEAAFDDGVMFEHFASLMHVQKILLNHPMCKLLGRCSVIHMLPRFDRLKSLEFSGLVASDKDHLKCVLCVLATSSNIKELRLSHRPSKIEANALWSVEKYINNEYKYLTRIVLRNILATKTYLKMIEQLFRHSPVLEVMVIIFAYATTMDEKTKFLTDMMSFYRASDKIKFDISTIKHAPIDFSGVDFSAAEKFLAKFG